MLLWFGLFDCGLGADWLAELPGKWRFGLGLGLWLGSWVLAVVLLYRLNRLCKVGGSFWLENLAGLAVCYGVVEGCQQLWQLNLASLAGQNELMPANQLVVLMWCFFGARAGRGADCFAVCAGGALRARYLLDKIKHRH